MIAACAVSVGVGIALVWHLVPEALRQVNTAELLAVVGLFLLPAGTVFAFYMERHGRRGAVRVEAAGGAEVGGAEAAALVADTVEGEGGAWETVWAAVAAGEAAAPAAAVRHAAAAGRREGAGRRPGTDAGGRRRREGTAVGAGER